MNFALNKKVLIAIPRFTVGGAEIQALNLAKELKNRGYNVVIGAFGSEAGEGYVKFTKAGLDCIHWGFQEKIILNPEKGLIGWSRKYRYCLNIIIKVRSLNVDYIIPFTYPSNVIFCRLIRWLNVKKCIWNQRDAGILFTGKKNEISALNNASVIVSNSLEGLKFLRRYVRKKIFHIPNGIDMGLYPSHNDIIKYLKVIMVGNVIDLKDHTTLIKAWKLVLIEFPNFQLIFAGYKGNKFNECEKLAIELGIENSIEFMGIVENVPNLLRRCYLAVFSSYNEGLPNGILEPMAAGLPVVASNIQGSREALGDHYEFLVEPQNHEQFAIKIICLLKDKVLREKIGKENLLRVSSSFSLKNMVDEYERILSV